MKKSIFVLSVLSFSSLSFASSLSVEGHPESVVVDEKSGDTYISIVGKELKPTEKDNDGFILKLSVKEDAQTEKLTKTNFLNAPKGLTLHDGVLYATDIDRVVMIDPQSGVLLGEVDLSPEKAVFLNDTVWLDGKLYVSATDLNTIYVVDSKAKTYEKLNLKDEIKAPNGLAVKAGEPGVLYMCEYAADGDKPIGRLVKIDLEEGSVKELSALRGLFDGLAWNKGELFFSDWAMDSGAGAVRKLSGDKVSNVTQTPMKGAADFYVTQDSVVLVPAMVDQKVFWVESAK